MVTDALELVQVEEELGDTIYKLSDYMKYVETLPDKYSLSRGQSGNYPLLPSALRRDSRGNRKYSRQTISNFLNQFKLNSHYYMDSPWDIKNDYEWMIHAQHYGIPTRLMDFTQSHIIALMFAVENAFVDEEAKDAVVWFLDPKALNLKHSTRTDMYVLSTENDRELKLDECDGPVAVQGRRLNNRINAQNGVFIYFQDGDNPLEELCTSEDVLKKVTISGQSKKDILVSLYAMGIGFSQIYPELSSVSKDILLKASISEYVKFLGEEGE